MTGTTPGAGRQLGVVVVHYGDPTPTLAGLQSVLADPSPIGRRVVVVDNSDNLPRQSLPPGVLHLACRDNPGFGAGANRGVARLAEGEPRDGEAFRGWVILNGDVELVPGYLAGAAGALERGWGAAAGPIHLDVPQGPLWYAGGRLRPWLGTVSQSLRAEDARRDREVSFLTGAALVVSRKAWDAVGGFDSSFFLYNEDLDLCMRLRRAGFGLGFVSSMVSVHHLGSATGSRRASALYLEHITRTRLLPYPQRAHRLWLALIHSGWVVARAVALLLGGGGKGGRMDRIRALFRGHRAALGSAWRGKGTKEVTGAGNGAHGGVK